MKIRSPLSADVYLRRNIGKTIPLVAVIVLAVLLISSIVALLNSIPLSIRTIYSSTAEYLGVTPRGDTSQTPLYVDDIKQNAPVPIERLVICRASGCMVRSIVGPWPFVVLGLNREDAEFYLKRQNVEKLIGRMPETGKPEAVISEPVARNLKLKLGSNLQSPTNPDGYSPFPVKVVGIAQTDRWLMIGDIDYQKANHFPPVDLAMAYAATPDDQRKLDAWAVKHFKGKRAQIYTFAQLDKDTSKNFAVLYAILNVIIATLVVVITLMMGLLINIYQGQRLIEFGLLQALGFTKRQLIRRTILESAWFIAIGWILGIGMAYLALLGVKAKLMNPNAWALLAFDKMAFAYTVPVPIAILIVATFTVLLRFRKFDPVGVVERRLV